MASLGNAINSVSAVDGLPHQVEHNNAARLIRRGLMVVAYATLEDFLRDRMQEVLDDMSSGHVPFEDLPESVRSMTTESALDALARTFRRMHASGEDLLPVIQKVAADVSSTSGGRYSLSAYGFGRGETNLSPAFLKKMMAALNVADPWGLMVNIANRASVGAGDLESELRSYLLKRNVAAHSTAASVESGHLASFRSISIAIALGFDIVASWAGRMIRDGDPRILNNKLDFRNEIDLVFIQARPRGFAAKRESLARATGVRSTVSEAWTLARTVAPRDPIVQSSNIAVGVELDWAC